MTLTAEKIGTQSRWRTISANNTAGTITVSSLGRMNTKPNENREQAIFTYVQTLRSLGKRRVNSADVADALDLPEKVVRRVMSEMTEKGIKAL